MAHRTSSSLSFVFGCCLVVGGACFLSTPAAAGFQWVSPDSADTSTSVVVPEVSSAPVQRRATTSPEVISPVIIQGSDRVVPSSLAAPAPAAPAPSYTAEAPTEMAAPVSLAPTPVAPTEQTLKVPASSKDKVLNGFANRVPLAVALRQIMPSDYGFSVDRDVALSTPVSWHGGKAWREVLHDMLAPAGLDMKEQGQMVRITRGAGAPATGFAASPLTQADLPSLAPEPALQPAAPIETARPAKSLTVVAPTRNVSEHTLQLPPGMVDQPLSPTPSFVDQAPIDVQPVAETWTANRGDTLHKVLEIWAKRARVEFNWKSEYDYPLQASITITGAFEDAVRNLLAGFQDAQPQPVARLYNNRAAGQSVLVVEARGNNFSE